ncbi:MAG: hypothetical protein JWP89_2471 [Schlesneria sp.]|nr:hypothetical protein [Schlesneria sp.]
MSEGAKQRATFVKTNWIQLFPECDYKSTYVKSCTFVSFQSTLFPTKNRLRIGQ